MSDRKGGPAAADVSWFGADMPTAQRACLVALAREVEFPTGTVISQEGDAVADLGVVRKGRVALRLHVPGKGMLTVLTVEPGDIFNWSGMVAPYRSTSTLVAVEPVEAVLFEAAGLREAVDADPLLSSFVYPRLLRAVARRLGATRLQLLDVFAGEGVEPW
ncbi:MAG: Crp/Fnr family transcriptional regulator [Candidatus Limnocylindrales bacterium]